MTTANDLRLFPQSFEVAARLNMQVLGEAQFAEVARIDDEIDLKFSGMLYWIGDKGDSSVGLSRVDATPMFPTREELETFITDNRAEFDKLAEAEELPQKFFWER